jgi:hypothetical protein
MMGDDAPLLTLLKANGMKVRILIKFDQSKVDYRRLVC